MTGELVLQSVRDRKIDSSDSILYGKSLFTVLEAAGAKKVRNLEKTGSVPYVLQTIKGGKLLNEGIANSVFDIVDKTSVYNHLKTNGSFMFCP
jgi:hypothetical protein